MRIVWGLALAILACSAWAQPSEPSAVQAVRIREVRFIGLSHVSPRDIDTVISVSPGDVWNDDTLVTIQKLLTTYYGRRGFFQAQVSSYIIQPSRGADVTLVVRVEEGQPCTIRSFLIEEPPGFKSRKTLQRFNDSMYSVTKVKLGDRYDEFYLNDRMRDLREWLISENFILANTDNFQLNFNEDKSHVDVVAKVDFGDRVTFGFEGNNIYSRGELSDFIKQLRGTGIGKDYVQAIRRRILEEYALQAYGNATVDVAFSEQDGIKRVTFIINEGPRIRLEKVRWEGLSAVNQQSAEELLKKNSTRLLERGFFVERDMDKIAQVVLEDLQAKGFLSSKLVTKSVVPGGKPNTVQYVAQYSESEQTFINQIELNGFTYITSEKALEMLGTHEGKPLNPFAIEEGIQKILRFYFSEGYLNFKVTTAEDAIVKFTRKNRFANIDVTVDEGDRFRVGEIRFEGLEKTRLFIVERELEVQTGDWWLGSKIDATENNLRRLGLFSDVAIRPMTSMRGANYRDMVIVLKESEPGAFEAGPGIRNDLGIRAFAQLSYSNILGRHWIGAMSVEANRRLNDQYRFVEYRADGSFIEPRFLGTKNLFTTSLATKKTRFPPNFNAATTQLTTGFERKVINPLTVKLFYKVERIRQFDVIVDGKASPEDNQSMLIGSIVPSIILDTRDSAFTTTKGQVTTLSLEYAYPYLSGQDPNIETKSAGYEKWNGSTKWYLSFNKIVWSNVFAGGFLRSNIPDRPVPLIKLFRLGGYSTIRGFNEDSINVDSFSVKGTLTYLNFRTQFDLPFIGELRFAPFLDAGNLFINNRYRGHPFFRAGTGAGLHYMTPVGPVNLDWGYKLNRVGNESPYQVHFSVGLI